ncbi:MAG: HU family DNA-binding protein [Phycisphaerae bacterium]
MATITKKDMIEHIVSAQRVPRSVVKQVVQAFLDGILVELDKGNRLEFRDFGIFECHHRPARVAKNPRTLDSVAVPCKRKVRFKASRLMRKRMLKVPPAGAHSDGHAAKAPGVTAESLMNKAPSNQPGKPL